jgi:putative ABC transport system substrate-binding protein
MSARQLVSLLVFSLLALPLAAEAQQAEKVYRIGFLSGTTTTMAGPLLYLRQGLRDLGYEEGRNILIESRWADGHDERLLALAEELVRLRPDVLVTASTLATAAAQQATKTIPIVMGAVDNPVREGFVKSLARPGGNTTGVALLNSDLAPKRLQLLKEIMPTLRRVAVLLNPRSPASREDLRQTEAAARRLNVTVRAFEVRELAEFQTAFTAIAGERPDSLIVVTDPVTRSHGDHIVEFAARNRLPAMYTTRGWVFALGGLISYGTEGSETWRRAASYVDRILKGAKPADLAVEQPTQFELLINMKTAKALGITIPNSLLLRADQVIE